MSAHEAIERHDHQIGHLQLGALARRAALVVALLAALLAFSEMLAESKVKTSLSSEARLVDVNVRAALGHTSPRGVDELAAKRDAASDAHVRYEIATVILQVGIVLASVAVITSAGWLLGMGALAGFAGGLVLLLTVLGV